MSTLVTETAASAISSAQQSQVTDAVNADYPLSGCLGFMFCRGCDINGAPDPTKDQLTAMFSGTAPTLVQLDAVIAAFILSPPAPPAPTDLPIVDAASTPSPGQIDISAATTGALPVARVTGAAPLASPTFTGVPAGPTAAPDTATTQLATTAYVQTELADYALASALAAKVDSSGGTLTGGTIAGATSLTGTATAAGGSTVALAGATTVTVPTVSFPNNSTAAASTAFVTAGLATKLSAAPSDDGYYMLRNGVWVAGFAPDYILSTTTPGSTISGTTLTTYLSGTSGTLIAGTYQVDWTITSLHSASASTQGVQVTLAGNNVPTAVIDGYAAPSNGSRTSVQNAGTYVHGGGTILVVAQVRRSTGSGNVTPQAGIVTLRRIA